MRYLEFIVCHVLGKVSEASSERMENVLHSTVDGAPKAAEAQTFFLIVFPQALEDDVIAVLDRVGVPGCTETRKVTGRGPKGRHFDSAVWPGADNTVFTVVDSEHAVVLSSALINFNALLEQRSHGFYGVRVFTWDVRR
jgi:hypothetical protein